MYDYCSLKSRRRRGNTLKTISIVLLVATAELGATEFDHSAWDRVLKASVNKIGEVDYAAIKANRKDLDFYIQQLAHASPTTQPKLFPAKAHEIAYWMNAYNAFVMKGVVDRWPTQSVRDLGALYGFFRRKDYVAGGSKISLVHLENEILRKQYEEPRLHFGIVCASISCPLLARDAFTGENLDRLLDRLTSQFINERRNVTIDPARNEVTLSAVFDWYKKDFVKESARGNDGLLAYVLPYLIVERRKTLAALRQPKVKFHDYDWSINDPGSRSRAKSPLDRELAGS
jgi:hypothetical protein